MNRRADFPLSFLPSILLLWASSASAGEVPKPSLDPAIRAEDLMTHIRYLASDDLKGRASGSAGEKAATVYIADFFKRLGLKPAGEEGTWFQDVRVRGRFELGRTNRLAVRTSVVEGVPEGPQATVLTLEPGKQFRPFSSSRNGKAEGPVVFAGYGVSAPDLGYDDYAGLDVRGKVVVIFRRTPRGAAWQGRRVVMRHATFIAKLALAQKKGAAALIVVNDPMTTNPRNDLLMTQGVGGQPGTIPYAHVTLEAGRKLFRALFGTSPAAFSKRIHQTGGARPASRRSDARIEIATELVAKYQSGRNVCALLEAGAGDATDEVVVVGGHHDHVGLGGFGSLGGRKARGQIHNGADDNASGTAGVMEIAAYLKSKQKSLRRSVLFLTFTGEELGLVGSQHFVRSPTLAWERLVAMLNMDMIGRLGKTRRVYVGGVGTSPIFRDLVTRAGREVRIPLAFGDGGRAPSDNTSFYNRGLPVLFFFSGEHPDYHRPGDDWEKIDRPNAVKIARLAAAVALDLARRKERPAFSRADGMGMFQPAGVFIGVAGEAGEKGFRLGMVRPGGPAATAGLKVGDELLSLNGKPTKDLMELRQALKGLKPDQEVPVQVLRGKKTLDLKLKPARRR